MPPLATSSMLQPPTPSIPQQYEPPTPAEYQSASRTVGTGFCIKKLVETERALGSEYLVQYWKVEIAQIINTN